MIIYRHEPAPVREMQKTREAYSSDSSGGEAPPVSNVPAAHTDQPASDIRGAGQGSSADIQSGQGSKPYLSIPEKTKANLCDLSYRLTGAALKAFVADIPDDAIIHYIDVGEGKHLHLRELLDGVAIVGKP